MTNTATVAERRSGISSRRSALILTGLGVFAALNLLIAVSVGRFEVPFDRALAIIWSSMTGGGDNLQHMDERIVWLVRVPRTLLAALSGAGLAIAGAALQGVFRNPLVAPQVLGISQGAALGGALAIFIGVSGVPMLGMVFVFALSALALVGLLARIDGRTEVITVILAGMVIGALFTAFVSLLQYFADPNTSLPAIVFWLMGSFATATWERLFLAAPCLIIGVALLWGMRFRLNILSLDDAEARSLGVKPNIERWIIFGIVAMIVGAQVSMSGIVGWIGLVVPHACRLLIGHDHRHLLPATIVAGAGYMVLVDTLARTLTPAEIPLGILTAILGAPVFAVLLRHHYRDRSAK